jgi:hypothetical protein
MDDGATSPDTGATTLALHQAALRASENLALLSRLAWDLREPLPAQVDEAVILLRIWLADRGLPPAAAR